MENNFLYLVCSFGRGIKGELILNAITNFSTRRENAEYFAEKANRDYTSNSLYRVLKVKIVEDEEGETERQGTTSKN